MASAAVNDKVTVLGKAFDTQRTVTADGAELKDPTLAAAKSGTLSTRTDDNTGVLTLGASHGFVALDRIDVYWSGGSRYGMSVTGVVGNDVTVDGGTGDNLPVQATAVTAMEPQLETFVVPFADLKFLGVSCAAPAWVVFLTAADAVVKAVYVEDINDAFRWDADDPNAPTSPFGSDVAKAYFSHGDSTTSRQVDALALKN